MHKVELDPKKLLGLRIIASDESPAKLQSPKIGVKGGVSDEDAPIARKSPIAAKVGSKV